METINVESYKSRGLIKEIYFDEGYKAATLAELLRMFYNDGTYNVGNSRATYEDPEYKIWQCYPGRHRSFENLLSIALTYFPETTVQELLETLIGLDIQDPEKDDLSFIFLPLSCPDINRITVCMHAVFTKIKLNAFLDYLPEDPRNSAYSWKELFETIGVKNVDDLMIKINENKSKYTT